MDKDLEYSTWESGSHALTGQHSGAGSGGLGAGEPVPRAWEQEGLLCLLPVAALGGLARAVQESPSWCCRQGEAGGLTSSATTQAQIQGSELAQLKSSENGWGTWKGQSCCSKAAGSPDSNNWKESWWSNIDGVTEARDLEQTNGNEYLQVKVYGQRNILLHTTAPTRQCCPRLCCCCLFACFILGKGCRGKGQIWGNGGDE